MTELKTECDGCKKTLNDVKMDNNKLHLHIKNLLSQSDQYQRKIERLSQGERAMQEKVRSSMDSVQQTELDKTKLTAENEELKRQQIDYITERSRLIANNNKLKLQLIKSHQLIEELNNEMQIHREQIDVAIPKNEELQLYANKLRQQLNKEQEDSNKRKEQYEMETHNYEEKVKELADRIKMYVKEIETLKLDNSKLKVT